MLAAMALNGCNTESILNGDDNRERIGGSGAVTAEERAVNGFTEIAFFTEGSIMITQGDAETLQVETDENLMQYLETTVAGGVLNIKVQEDPPVDIDPSRGIKWEITVVDLDSIALFGAGDLEMGDLATDQLSLKVAGAMDVDIDHLAANDLEVVLTGVGSLRLSGEVARGNLRLAGTGSIDTSRLVAREVTAAVSGVGDISVWATDALTATISGLGSIEYFGSPTVTRAGTGAGSIRSAGDK
jgi:hypothetical protein